MILVYAAAQNQSLRMRRTNFTGILRSLNLNQTTRPSDYQQRKGICRIVDFAVSADNRVKLKESEKRNKYLDLARELKKNYGTWK